VNVCVEPCGPEVTSTIFVKEPCTGSLTVSVAAYGVAVPCAQFGTQFK